MSSTDDGSRHDTRPTYNRIFRQARAMDEMMRRIGVTADGAHTAGGPDEWYDARGRCLGCDAGPDCSRWLTSTPSADEAPLFCPNAAYFARCRKADA